MNDVHIRIVVCCYRGRFGTDLNVLLGGVLICFCFHVVADVVGINISEYCYDARTHEH